jgi:polyhydroxybutyrate depolymerase
VNNVHAIISLIFLIGIGLGFSVNVAAADLIPSWIKETVGFWSEDLIDDVTFVNAMEWMIKNNIIVNSELSIVDSSDYDDLSDRQVVVPEWIKNNARFWANNQINDSDFLSGITYLYKEEIVKSPNVIVNELNPEWTLGPGDYEFSLISDNLEREYIVHVPSSYDAIKPIPVVFNIHGGGGNGENQRNMSNMDIHSEKHGYIVVYPDGTGVILLEKEIFNWNGKMDTKPEKVVSKINDVKFFSKMIEELKNKFNIDEKRVYATGISNGGQMAHRLGCDLPDKIAAIAPVGAPIGIDYECNPSNPVPTMIIHGKKDLCALYDGGQCGGCYQEFLGLDPSVSKFACVSINTITNDWIERNSCSSESQVTYQKGGITCKTYDDCTSNSEVMLCVGNNMGHTWPSEISPFKMTVLDDRYYSLVGDITYDISNEQIWEFFKRHSLE